MIDMEWKGLRREEAREETMETYSLISLVEVASKNMMTVNRKPKPCSKKWKSRLKKLIMAL